MINYSKLFSVSFFSDWRW